MTKINQTQQSSRSAPPTATASSVTKANPLGQMQATARVLDQAFLSAPLTLDAQATTSAPTVLTTQEQLQLFAPLQNLVGQPLGKVGEAFVLPQADASAFSEADMQSELLCRLGKKIPDALGRLFEAMSARQVATIKARINQASVAMFGVTIKPEILAQIRAQVVAPLSEQLRSQNGIASAQSDDRAEDAQPSGDAVVRPVVDTLAQTVAQLQNEPNTQGMDIAALVEMVIMQCGQGSELDLRQLANEMQAHLDTSKALRALKEQQARDAAAIKGQVDHEYAVLTSVQPPATTPVIDATKCSPAQFESWRGVSYSDPVVDDSVDPPRVTYAAPQLASPNPLNANDIPSAFKNDDSNGNKGASFTNAAGQAVTGSCDGLAAWQQTTSDLLDDQTDITQQMQLKLQMAQQAYTQCMQMVSNVMKSDNDTKSGVIKNLSN